MVLARLGPFGATGRGFPLFVAIVVAESLEAKSVLSLLLRSPYGSKFEGTSFPSLPITFVALSPSGCLPRRVVIVGMR